MLLIGAKRSLLVQRQFTPSSFFSNNEQGVWYEPSLTNGTLFQDSAGTTPVTAVEQPVGLMLDKSKGLIRGPEIVLDPSFDDASKWAFVQPTSASVSVSGGKLFISTLDGTYCQAAVFPFIPAVVGRYYEYVISVESVSGSGIAVSAGALGAAITSAGTHRGVILATTNAAILVRRFAASASSAVVTSISVRELPGNHAYQTTAIDRPILRNRYNLLTKTEQFDDAVWVKTNTTASIDTIQDNAVNGFHAVSQSMSFAAGSWRLRVEAKKGTAQGVFIRIRDSVDAGVTHVSVSVDLGTGLPLVAGAVGVAQVSPLADGWFGIELSGVIEPGTKVVLVGIIDGGTTFYAGQGKTSLIRKVSLVPADQAHLPYQRVNTATDYDSDASKFPLYLAANGTNTWMQTNSIDFTATDKVSVFAGVRKLSDAATGMFLELSPVINTNPGSFALRSPHTAGANYAFLSSGTILGGAVSGNSYPTPISNVLTAVGNISGDRAILRINSTEIAVGVGDQGTGNYGNYPLFLFRRAGNSVPLNGNFYGLLIRGALTSDAQTIAMERWLAPKTGVTL